MPYLCTLKSREKCLCLENDEMIFLNKHQTGNYLRMIFVKSLLDSILNQERWDWGEGDWEWGEILYKHEHFSPQKTDSDSKWFAKSNQNIRKASSAIIQWSHIHHYYCKLFVRSMDLEKYTYTQYCRWNKFTHTHTSTHVFFQENVET